MPDDFLDFGIEEITLEKMKIATNVRLAPQMMHDAELRAHVVPDAVGMMLLEIRTFVYAERLECETVRVPFEKAATETIDQRPDLSKPLIVGGIVGGILLAASVAIASAVLTAFVVAALGTAYVVLLLASQRSHRVTVTARAAGDVVVDVERFATFPDNQTIYPDSLGAVVYQTRQSSSIDWKNDESR